MFGHAAGNLPFAAYLPRWTSAFYRGSHGAFRIEALCCVDYIHVITNVAVRITAIGFI